MFIPPLSCSKRSHDLLGNIPWVTYALIFVAPCLANTFWEEKVGGLGCHCKRKALENMNIWRVFKNNFMFTEMYLGILDNRVEK